MAVNPIETLYPDDSEAAMRFSSVLTDSTEVELQEAISTDTAMGQLVLFSVLDEEELLSREIVVAEEVFKDSPYLVSRKPSDLIAELYDQMLQQRQASPETSDKQPGFGIMAFEADSKFADVARYAEATIFKNAWNQNDNNAIFAKKMHKEYGPYENDSKFMLLLDTDRLDDEGLPEIAGVARVVGGRVDLLKTVHDMSDPEYWGMAQEDILADLKVCQSPRCANDDTIGDPSKTWDYSSLAVSPEYRTGDAYQILSREVYTWALREGINTVTTIFVERFFNAYRFRGIPFRIIAGAEPRVHMDEVSVPAVLHLPEVEDMLAEEEGSRARNSYASMAEGQGLSYSTFDIQG